MRIVRCLVSLAALLLVGCTPAAPAPPAATSGSSSLQAVASRVSSSSLPPFLTAGAPITLSPSSPLVSDDQKLVAKILTSRRHASVQEAAGSIPFTPRLPGDAGGATLQYLLTSPQGAQGGDTLFWAVYSDGLLQVVERRANTDAVSQPPGTAATKVHGLPASVGTQNGLVTVTMNENGLHVVLWYRGSEQDAMRIAESLPQK